MFRISYFDNSLKRVFKHELFCLFWWVLSPLADFLIKNGAPSDLDSGPRKTLLAAILFKLWKVNKMFKTSFLCSATFVDFRRFQNFSKNCLSFSIKFDEKQDDGVAELLRASVLELGQILCTNGSEISEKWSYPNFDDGFEFSDPENPTSHHFIQIEKSR